MQITRYGLVIKARNTAKYGAMAPKEAYVNSWTEEVACFDLEDESYLLEVMYEEEMRVQAELEAYLAS